MLSVICLNLDQSKIFLILPCILNISETTHPILTKFHRNVPAIVLFRIPGKNLIPSKTHVTMATKLKNTCRSLKIFFSETRRPRATKFGM